MNERKKGKKKRRDFWRRNSSFSRHVQLKEIDIRYSCRSTRKSNAGLEWMMQQQLKYFSNYFFWEWLDMEVFFPPNSFWQGPKINLLGFNFLDTLGHALVHGGSPEAFSRTEQDPPAACRTAGQQMENRHGPSTKDLFNSP